MASDIQLFIMGENLLKALKIIANSPELTKKLKQKLNRDKKPTKPAEPAEQAIEEYASAVGLF